MRFGSTFQEAAILVSTSTLSSRSACELLATMLNHCCPCISKPSSDEYDDGASW